MQEQRFAALSDQGTHATAVGQGEYEVMAGLVVGLPLVVPLDVRFAADRAGGGDGLGHGGGGRFAVGPAGVGGGHGQAPVGAVQLGNVAVDDVPHAAGTEFPRPVQQRGSDRASADDEHTAHVDRSGVVPGTRRGAGDEFERVEPREVHGLARVALL